MNGKDDLGPSLAAAPPGRVAELNRRIHPRASLEVEITLGSESNFFAGITNDVSTGGVFVVTYARPPAVGTEIDVEFQLPAVTLHTRGQVRWTRPATEGAPPGIAIGFINLSEADRAEIERFCRARAPSYYDLDD